MSLVGAVLLLIGAASEAAAQDTGLAGDYREGRRWFENYENRHRYADDQNPTGFGKPGQYWDTPTGSRIARGSAPKRQPTAGSTPSKVAAVTGMAASPSQQGAEAARVVAQPKP